jgi:hypothetical protein
MNKKDLKMYEAPTVEILLMGEAESILAGTTGKSDTPNVPVEEISEDDRIGF